MATDRKQPAPDYVDENGRPYFKRRADRRAWDRAQHAGHVAGWRARQSAAGIRPVQVRVPKDAGELMHRIATALREDDAVKIADAARELANWRTGHM